MVRVFTAFSGYDSQCLALRKAGIEFDLVGWSEIDKYAIIAHDALFPEYRNRNYGDISKIDWDNVPNFDLFTYSFPCQDISLAGRMQGVQEGSETRSALLWECKKAIAKKRPKYLLMENVKNLVSKSFLPELEKWIDLLSGYGYVSKWEIMDSASFGVPQKRERVIMVSILSGQTDFVFPRGKARDKRLKDVLETEVDEKYYVKELKFKNYEDKKD